MSATDFTVENLSAFLATVEAEIAGVNRAYAAPPETVSGNGVVFVNLPGPATLVPEGSDDLATEVYETRQFYCNLLVAPTGTGLSGEIIARTMPFFSAVRDKFLSLSASGRSGQVNILGLVYMGDSGILQNMEYGGIQYTGIRFTVAVTGRVRASYDDY